MGDSISTYIRWIRSLCICKSDILLGGPPGFPPKDIYFLVLFTTVDERRKDPTTQLKLESSPLPIPCMHPPPALVWIQVLIVLGSSPHQEKTFYYITFLSSNITTNCIFITLKLLRPNSLDYTNKWYSQNFNSYI